MWKGFTILKLSLRLHPWPVSSLLTSCVLQAGGFLRTFSLLTPVTRVRVSPLPLRRASPDILLLLSWAGVMEIIPGWLTQSDHRSMDRT